MFQKKNPSIVAVASGKGGVGKSTVAVNLARAFKLRGMRVGLLDADLYGPSLGRLLEEERPPRQEGERIIPARCEGMQMISMAHFRKGHEAAAVRAPIANGMVEQFLNDVVWDSLDILVIDFPPGTGDIQLTLSQKAALSGALLVTTPQELAIMDVRRAAHLFQQVRVPLLGIVENMNGFQGIPIFGEGGGERLAAELGIPLLESFPLDPETARRADLGRSPFEVPVTPLARQFESLAEKTLLSLKERPLIQNISLKDPQHLQIDWASGKSIVHRLSELQRRCPCAACNGQSEADEQVSATEVESVGRYALRIRFTSGCSNGLYALKDLA